MSKVEQFEEIQQPNLKKCPMCGAYAIFKEGTIYTHTAYKVICSNCGVETPFEICGCLPRGAGMEPIYTSKVGAKNKVAYIWNRRFTDG